MLEIFERRRPRHLVGGAGSYWNAGELSDCEAPCNWTTALAVKRPSGMNGSTIFFTICIPFSSSSVTAADNADPKTLTSSPTTMTIEDMTSAATAPLSDADFDTKEIVHIADQDHGIPIPKSSGTDYRFAIAGGNDLKRSLFRH